MFKTYFILVIVLLLAVGGFILLKNEKIDSPEPALSESETLPQTENEEKVIQTPTPLPQEILVPNTTQTEMIVTEKIIVEEKIIIGEATTIEEVVEEQPMEETLLIVEEFTIEADDVGLYPSPIEVTKGNTVKITFVVRAQGTYFGGLDFRSTVWGDTGKVSPGSSKTVEFIAAETFEYKSYWPSSNVLKAIGMVMVK